MINQLRLDFVVQQANYKEMIDFVKLGKRLGVDKVYFSKIINWGTFTEEEYNHHCVLREGHVEFKGLLEVLKDAIFDDPIVNLGNLTEF